MTLKKLAELAHVSPSTASKALANSREVSEETVRHVRQVARDSGYLRQCKERRLSYRKPTAPTIAVVCPEIVSVYYSAIATCLSRLAESHGGTSAVYLAGFEAERQSALLEELGGQAGGGCGGADSGHGGRGHAGGFMHPRGAAERGKLLSRLRLHRFRSGSRSA